MCRPFYYRFRRLDMNIVKTPETAGFSSQAYTLLINVFIEAISKDLLYMQESIKTGDRDMIARLTAHIKNVAGNLEISNLVQCAEELECMAKESQMDDIAGAYAGMCREFDEIIHLSGK
jgi:HPt (histidine-containing phosphotransfer) domain-containing protein